MESLDIALNGPGFFQVRVHEVTAYTRNGSFSIDANRKIVVSYGYPLLPEVTLPENYRYDTITLTRQGLLSVKITGSEAPIQVAQLKTHVFTNPAGLSQIGSSFYIETTSSGDRQEGTPGSAGQPEVILSLPSDIQDIVSQIITERKFQPYHQ